MVFRKLPYVGVSEARVRENSSKESINSVILETAARTSW